MLGLLVGIMVVAAVSASAATITGSVVIEGSATAPSRTWLIALDAQDSTELETFETTDGTYVIEVPEGREVLLVAVPFSGRVVDGYAVHELTNAVARLTARGAVTRDLVVEPCRELILQGWGPDGTPSLASDLRGPWFVVDSTGVAVDALVLGIDRGDGSEAVPAFCVPVGEAWTLYIPQELPGAGRLTLPVEDRAGPFVATEQTANVLDLDLAVAVTQVARAEWWLGRVTGEGFEPPEEIVTRIEAARTALAELEGQPSGRERAAALDQAAADAVIGMEDLLLWRSAEQARSVRTGELAIEVVDRTGAPVAGAAVRIRQTSRDFGLGTFDPLDHAGEAAYERLADAGLNFVTAGFYWTDIAPQGEIDWEWIDHGVGVRDLAAEGWRVKGHPLTWLYDDVMPAELIGAPLNELVSASVDHVDEIVRHYSDTVHIWDVNNEASAVHASGGLSRSEMDIYLRAVFAAARAADPAATLILNNHFDRFGAAVLQERLLGREETEYFTLPVRAFVGRAIATGVDFDVIGQQLYNGGLVGFFADLGIGPLSPVATFDLAFLVDTIEELAALGKPVHVTEHSVSSRWDSQYDELGAGYWRRRWDEQAQADYVEAVYTLLFGLESVEAITWWNISDERSFLDDGGWIREDGTAKPALERIEALVAGWTTDTVTTTDAGGTVHARVWAGRHEVSVSSGKATAVATVSVPERSHVSVQLAVVDPPRQGRRTPR